VNGESPSLSVSISAFLCTKHLPMPVQIYPQKPFTSIKIDDHFTISLQVYLQLKLISKILN